MKQEPVLYIGCITKVDGYEEFTAPYDTPEKAEKALDEMLEYYSEEERMGAYVTRANPLAYGWSPDDD